MRRAAFVAASVALALLLGAGVLGADETASMSASEEQLTRTAADAQRRTFTGDAEQGWRLFREKGCMRCHAVWGQGGDWGPDLGRTRTLGHATAGELAGRMWNHVPRMWEKAEEGGVQLPSISPEEMSHLFALLLFIRYADEPGDPTIGKRLLEDRGCTECHSVDEPGERVGPDLAKWARFVNPVVWAQKMWSHAAEMERSMKEAGIAWPQFEGDDLNNIVAYVRARAGTGAKAYLEPGSIARGQDVFETRGCETCHLSQDGERIGPDLQAIELPDTLAGIAAHLWNHAPQMLDDARPASAAAGKLEAQEMADVITFLIARRYFLAEGDAEAGAKVFFGKRCVTCHAIVKFGGSIGPRLSALEGKASPVFMAHVMWDFGPQMLGAMADHGIPWPHFEGSEMADLIAYLNRETRQAEKEE